MNPRTMPSFTRVPNAVLELMPELTNAELRVVLAVVRQTFGWHRDEAPISLSLFMKITGLSRPGVLNALNSVLHRGFVHRTRSGRTFAYTVLVNQFDQLSSSTTPCNGAAVVNVDDRSVAQQGKLVDSLNKGTTKDSHDVVEALRRLGLTTNQARTAVKVRDDFSLADVSRCADWLKSSHAQNPVALLWTFLRGGRFPSGVGASPRIVENGVTRPLSLNEIKRAAEERRLADPELAED